MPPTSSFDRYSYHTRRLTGWTCPSSDGKRNRFATNPVSDMVASTIYQHDPCNCHQIVNQLIEHLDSGMISASAEATVTACDQSNLVHRVANHQLYLRKTQTIRLTRVSGWVDLMSRAVARRLSKRSNGARRWYSDMIPPRSSTDRSHRMLRCC